MSEGQILHSVISEYDKNQWWKPTIALLHDELWGLNRYWHHARPLYDWLAHEELEFNGGQTKATHKNIVEFKHVKKPGPLKFDELYIRKNKQQQDEAAGSVCFKYSWESLDLCFEL